MGELWELPFNPKPESTSQRKDSWGRRGRLAGHHKEAELEPLSSGRTARGGGQKRFIRGRQTSLSGLFQAPCLPWKGMALVPRPHCLRRRSDHDVQRAHLPPLLTICPQDILKRYGNDNGGRQERAGHGLKTQPAPSQLVWGCSHSPSDGLITDRSRLRAGTASKQPGNTGSSLVSNYAAPAAHQWGEGHVELWGFRASEF